MAGFRYLATDLRTGTLLGELPAEAVTFGWELNGPGQLSGTVRPTAATAIKTRDSTEPVRTAIWVDLNGVLVWGGVIWKRDYDSDRRAYQIQASGFLSYLAKRLITVVRSYLASDQLALVRDLVTYAQTGAGADIGILVGAETSTTVRDVVYDPSELRQILAEIAQLAGMIDGFDFEVAVAYDTTGVPSKTLRLGAPRLGLTTGASPFLVEFPGRVSQYQLTEDGDRMATTIWGRSTLESGATVTLTGANPAPISNGYPALDLPVTYDDVRDTTRLQALIDADIAALAKPVALFTATIRNAVSPIPGEIRMGDNVRFRITDPLRFPAGPRGEPGLDRAFRTLSATVNPGPNLAATTMALTFGEALV